MNKQQQQQQRRPRKSEACYKYLTDASNLPPPPLSFLPTWYVRQTLKLSSVRPDTCAALLMLIRRRMRPIVATWPLGAAGLSGRSRLAHALFFSPLSLSLFLSPALR